MPRVPSHCSAFISGVLSPEDIYQLPRPLGQRGGPGSRQVKAKALVLAEFTARDSCRLGVGGRSCRAPAAEAVTSPFRQARWVASGHLWLQSLSVDTATEGTQRGLGAWLCQRSPTGGRGQLEERGTMTEGNGIKKETKSGR